MTEFNTEEFKPEQSQAFLKFDDGKVLMSLVDPAFVVGVAKILTYGSVKYAPNNWQLNTNIERYKDALLRHTYSYLDGEMLDPESSLPHLDHMACNLMFLRYFEHGKGSK